MKTILTMVARHGVSKDNINAYTLITSDYQTVTLKKDELIKMMASNTIEVMNLGIEAKGIVSTNGALDKYTFINESTNMPEGATKAVIIDRIEKEGKLAGYTAFMQNGQMAELSIADAVALATKGAIANGKIRHTQDGDIVSAIKGNFILRQIRIDKAPKGQISIQLMYFGTTVKANEHGYFGAIVSCTSATEMSKITTALSKSNAKIISSVLKVVDSQKSKETRESLAIKRMGVNSLYGVFEIEALKHLVASGAKLKFCFEHIVIAATEYTPEGTYESTIMVNRDWNIVGKNTESEELDKEVKTYADKIITTFNKVEVKVN